MTTTAAKKSSASTKDRIATLTKPLVETPRRAGSAWIDSYEKQVDIVTSFQGKIADVVNIEPVASMTSAYADLTRDLTAAQVSVARSLLRV
jgi:hypothetical protein